MKVKVGGSVATTPDQAIALYKRALFSTTKNQVIYAGRFQARRLASVLDVVANAEADKLYSVLSDIIDNPTQNRGLSGMDLERGMAQATDDSGSIEWKDLTYKYLVEKARVDTRYTPAFNRIKGIAPRPYGQDKFQERNFFRYLGGLSAYFRRQSSSIVQSRMGGVRVTMDEDGLDQGGRASQGAQTLYPSDLRIFIDRINIEIFPNIEAALLPGLASRRWTDLLGKAGVEDQIFGDIKSGAKLIQTHKESSFYRPLVAPAIQFWILVRIPAVIKKRLQLYLTRAQVHDQSL